MVVLSVPTINTAASGWVQKVSSSWGIGVRELVLVQFPFSWQGELLLYVCRACLALWQNIKWIFTITHSSRSSCSHRQRRRRSSGRENEISPPSSSSSSSRASEITYGKFTSVFIDVGFWWLLQLEAKQLQMANSDLSTNPSKPCPGHPRGSCMYC